MKNDINREPLNPVAQRERYALIAELPPASSIQAGTANLIKTLCSLPDNPFCAVVATDHEGAKPIPGPWDNIPTYTLIRPKSIIPQIKIGLGLLDIKAFQIQTPKIFDFLNRNKVNHVFILQANNPRFAHLAGVIAANIPSTVYFIDDFVADSFIYRMRQERAEEIRHTLLKYCKRIFTISPVYAGDLQALTERPCDFLPIPISQALLDAPIPKPTAPRTDRKIIIHHCGQIHHLYADAVKNLCELLKSIGSKKTLQIDLEFYGRIDEATINKSLSIKLNEQKETDSFQIKVRGEVSPQALRDAQSNADFLLLANSFLPQWEKQVRCSLSSKITEYLISGTPMLIYGPEYSGLVQHIARHNAGFIITEKDNLKASKHLTEILEQAAMKKLDHSIVNAAINLAKHYHSGSYFLNKMMGNSPDNP